MKIILTKKRKILGKILHETVAMIHGVSNDDLDWAEVKGIAYLFIAKKPWLIKKVD